ncbi:MAG: tetratricopeptide repeat protein [Syntrophobacteria bacterium]
MNTKYLIPILIGALVLSGCTAGMPTLSTQPSQNAGVLTLVSQADEEISAGQYQSAEAFLERALRIEPLNPVLWQRLAQVRLAQEKYHQAENLAFKSNTLAPDNSQLRSENWMIIGQARQGVGNGEGAKAAFEKARTGE